MAPTDTAAAAAAAASAAPSRRPVQDLRLRIAAGLVGPRPPSGPPLAWLVRVFIDALRRWRRRLGLALPPSAPWVGLGDGVVRPPLAPLPLAIRVFRGLVIAPLGWWWWYRVPEEGARGLGRLDDCGWGLLTSPLWGMVVPG